MTPTEAENMHYYLMRVIQFHNAINRSVSRFFSLQVLLSLWKQQVSKVHWSGNGLIQAIFQEYLNIERKVVFEQLVQLFVVFI